MIGNNTKMKSILEIFGFETQKNNIHSKNNSRYSLTELFMIEDSRGSIVKLLRLPKDIANELHSIDQKNSFFIAKMFKNYTVEESIRIESQSDQERLTTFHTWLNRDGLKIVTAIDKDKQFVKKNKNKSYKDILALVNAEDVVDPEIAKRKAKEMKDNTMMSFTNGFYWLDLKSYSCGKEGQKMGHCGADARGTLISLRDKKNDPHVTITLSNNHKDLLQIKGKQNLVPDKKYWQYVKDLLDREKYNFKDTEIMSDAKMDGAPKRFLEFLDVDLLDPPDWKVDQHNDEMWTLIDGSAEVTIELDSMLILSILDPLDNSTPKEETWDKIAELLDYVGDGERFSVDEKTWTLYADEDYETDQLIEHLFNKGVLIYPGT